VAEEVLGKTAERTAKESAGEAVEQAAKEGGIGFGTGSKIKDTKFPIVCDAW